MKSTVLWMLAFLFCLNLSSQCNNVLFILDDSGSVSSSERLDMENSVQTLADEIYNANNNSQIGVVQYGQPNTNISTPPFYYITLPLTTNPTINLVNDPDGNTFIEDVLPNSINAMINDGLFSSGGEFENINAIFIFTDAYINLDCSSNLSNCDGCTVPALACGYQYLTDLSNSFGGIPISVFRVLADPNTANGIQQNGGILIEQNNFEISEQQIIDFTASLGCFDSSIEASNTCIGDTTDFSITSDETIVSILWDFGDGNTSTLENPSHTYAAAGTYTVTVTVTTAIEVVEIIELVTIFEIPVANTATNYILCDDVSNDGFETFDLSVKDAEILGAQSSSDFSVSYFLNTTDALTNMNPLPTNYTNISNNQEIVARIYSSGNPDCFDVSSFLLIVDEQAVANPASDYHLCDDATNDGFETFDLSTKDAEVLGTQSTTDFSIAYYLSNNDAINDFNPLPTSYTNIMSNQQIFVKVTSLNNTDCFNITSFLLVVSSVPVAEPIPDFTLCENVSNIISLSAFNDAILDGQSSSVYNVTYYDTQDDAEAGINALNNSQEILNDLELFFRIENNDNSECYDTSSFNIVIYEFPFEDEEILTCNAINFELDASIDDEATYLWDDGSTGATNTVDDYGTYTVTITVGTCVETKQFDLLEEENCIIPQGISPNGDGLNDDFDISFLNAENIVIFNRYGTEIFNRDNYKNEWDGKSKNGKELPTGTYFYIITTIDEQIPGWVYLNRSK